MDTKEIQQMFSEMGLGSSEQRDKLVRDFSIYLVDSKDEAPVEIKIYGNTLNPEYHA